MGCRQSTLLEETLSKSERLRNYRRSAVLSYNLVQTSTQEPPYQVERLLGTGSMGTVTLVHRKDKKELYACKTIRRLHNAEMLEELRNEINIVSRLDYPHIVKFLHVYYGPSQTSIVMEYCSGGDLYTRAPYTEVNARRVLRPILRAVAYLHQQGFIHRDLKMENVMFHGDTVKIIDFGLSCRYQPGHRLRQVGTLQTMAPEVFSGDYDSQCDVWSVGVMAFELLCGIKPFRSTHLASLFNEIAGAKYRRFPVGISQQAKTFVQQMLQKDPHQRPTIQQALEYPWIQAKTKSWTLQEALVTQLQAYAQISTLQKVTSLVVAHQRAASNNPQLDACRETFLRLDGQNKGVLDLDDLRRALLPTCKEYDINHWFAAVDVYGDGVICFTEFLAVTLLDNKYWTPARIAEAFEQLANGKDTITVDGLRLWLGRLATPERVDDILHGVTDISLEDFGKEFHQDEPKVIELEAWAKVFICWKKKR